MVFTNKNCINQFLLTLSVSFVNYVQNINVGCLKK